MIALGNAPCGAADWWRAGATPLSRRVKSFVREPYRECAQADTGVPRITVVTPSFNQGRYLEETILSVLNQHYPNLEYFIVDGGSSDHSVDIIRKYERFLAGWVSEPDRGQADAIAKGFDKATGAILCWINSDDILLPNALAAVGSEFSTRPETQFVYGHSLHCNEATDVTRLICTYPDCYWPAVNRADNIFQGSIFWSRAAYERFGGLDTGLSFAMEYPLIHYLMREESGVFLNCPLAAFRQHGDQKTRVLHAVGERELQLLYGTIQLPLHWAVLMFATRLYRLVSNRNLVQKLRIAAHGLVVSRNQRAATRS